MKFFNLIILISIFSISCKKKNVYIEVNSETHLISNQEYNDKNLIEKEIESIINNPNTDSIIINISGSNENQFGFIGFFKKNKFEKYKVNIKNEYFKLPILK